MVTGKKTSPKTTPATEKITPRATGATIVAPATKKGKAAAEPTRKQPAAPAAAAKQAGTANKAAPASNAKPAKKAAALEKVSTVKKVAAAKKAVNLEKSPPAKKSAPAKKGAPAKKLSAVKKAPLPKSPPAPAPQAAVRRRGGAAAEPETFIDPGAQLDKLAPEITPARRTTRGATRGAAPAAAAVPGLPAGFFAAYTGEPLGEQSFELAAQALGCDVAAVKAVAEVESRGSGFDPMNRPTILYERHVFSRCTLPKGKFDGANPEVSFSRPYAPGTYGNREQQWQKFGRAMQLDATAALKAPSWGMFQILGENHKACGFADVAGFVRAMTISPVEHLKAFVAFVRSSPRMLQAIRNRDWAGFARGYNGPAYATFKYDTKIAAAYARHGGRG